MNDKHKTFDDLHWEKRRGLGNQSIEYFANGFGVSVIDFGYGCEKGWFEIAVLKGEHICYSTPITDDVIGNLDQTGVTRVMAQVQELPIAAPDVDRVVEA